MFDALRKQIAAIFSPPGKSPARQQRMYAMSRPSRLTTGWGPSTTSEDTELYTSLLAARNRSRALVRDAAYAKRAKNIVQNNVIGTGIGLQAKIENSRGTMNERINSDVEAQWEEWCQADQCHTGQSMHFSAIERQLIGQVFEAGEIFVRLHRAPFGRSTVPLGLEIIEPERIADQFQPTPIAPHARVRLGVELNNFHAPIAYWIRSIHPGELRINPEQTAIVERVPAADIIHLRTIDRWPQTRGIPWMHAAARKLNDMDGLTEAEITAARAAACYMGFIESPDGETMMGEDQPDGSREVELSPAMIEHLAPGEKFNYAAPNRPNAQLDPFMRMMLREVAAGTGTSYESLSRDYSQSNYSSSRLALLDDRDLWRVLQMWFIRDFRMRVHQVWLQQAVLSRTVESIPLEQYAIAPKKFELARFKPRGWSWIDPVKEVSSYREAVRCGFMTVSDVIAITGQGRDLEDVLKERRYELDRMADANLLFDTDPATVAIPPKPTAENQPQQAPTDTGANDPAVKHAEKMLKDHRNKLEDMSDVF